MLLLKMAGRSFNRKGNTCYGIAAELQTIVKSILFNENRIYPVSVHLDGQYGMNDIFLSVPTIIDKTGAKEIVEINMKEDEQKALEESYKVLKRFLSTVRLREGKPLFFMLEWIHGGIGMIKIAFF